MIFAGRMYYNFLEVWSLLYDMMHMIILLCDIDMNKARKAAWEQL